MRMSETTSAGVLGWRMEGEGEGKYDVWHAGATAVGTISGLRLLRLNRRKVGSDQEQCSDIEGLQPQSTVPWLQGGEREPLQVSDKHSSTTVVL